MKDGAPDVAPWLALFAASGAVALLYELVWMRRLGWLLGGSAPAAAVTAGAFMGGLALGAALAPRLKGAPGRTYAVLEALAAVWALAFPWLLGMGRQAVLDAPALRPLLAVVLLTPPTVAMGATWPVLAARFPARAGAALYAANTAGAVGGVLLGAFLAIPAAGVRGTEVGAACLGLGLAVVAWVGLGDQTMSRPARGTARVPWRLLLAAAAGGFAALGLEVTWFRLAVVGLGATVQMHATVLATFLTMLAAGAFLGRSWPREPWLGVTGGLAALGVLALLGFAAWTQLPFALAAAWRTVGPDGMLGASALLAAMAMGGAPAASGLSFASAVRAADTALDRDAGRLMAANTLGAVVGAWAGGLWAVPALEPHGAVLLFSGVAVGAAGLAATSVAWRWSPLVLAGLLALALPVEDARLFAVGVHLRLAEFANPTTAGVQRFATEGWELLSYDHGPTGAVAVGRSTRTGNVWLSINGKVDASTGDDMPTQVLSGTLPVRMADDARRVLVVGLASGITAGAVLAEPGVEELVVLELEPAVERASHAFDHINGRPLDDPRTTLVVDDARAWLDLPGPAFDVIISEPSNPWISGVSNLFTHEYWLAARVRLAPGGVMCQWVQLYGLGPTELRALVRTFTDVFPDTYLFETIPGSDALLVGGVGVLPDDLPLAPRLTPPQVRRLGGVGWLNTDDQPRVEWRAPRYLYTPTGAANAALLAEVAGTP